MSKLVSKHPMLFSSGYQTAHLPKPERCPIRLSAPVLLIINVQLYKIMHLVKIREKWLNTGFLTHGYRMVHLPIGKTLPFLLCSSLSLPPY